MTSDERGGEFAFSTDAGLGLPLILDQLPILVYVYDLQQQRTVYANRQTSAILGYSPEEVMRDGRRPFFEAVHPDDLPRFRQSRQQTASAADGDVIVGEYRVQHADGRWCWLRCRDTVLARTSDGTPSRLVGTAEDVTERRSVEQTLRESVEQFRVLCETSPAMVGIYQDLRCRYVSHSAGKIVGFPVDELLNRDFTELVHPDFRDLVRAHSLARQRGEETPKRYEFKIVTKDGQERWIDCAVERIDYQGQPAILGVALDVTDRKQAEARIRGEQRLLRRLLRLQEHERRLIAYDIHDGFIQDVVGAQMALESMIDHIKASCPSCLDEVILLRRLLRNAINEGRRMISELRPMLIDSMGIVEAIEYLVGEEEALGKIDVQFTHSVRFERLALPLEGTAFRIVQEALNNVKRHAQVGKAEVRLTQIDDRILIEVEDHGIGFAADEIPEDRFGLEGIRERARLFGGKSTIRSSPGQGTVVSVELPVELPEELRDESELFRGEPQ